GSRGSSPVPRRRRRGDRADHRSRRCRTSASFPRGAREYEQRVSTISVHDHTLLPHCEPAATKELFDLAPTIEMEVENNTGCIKVGDKDPRVEMKPNASGQPLPRGGDRPVPEAPEESTGATLT